jgi:hypothetical protein
MAPTITTTWTGNSSDGLWGTSGNWDHGVPQAGWHVILPDLSAAYSVLLSSVTPLVNSVQIGDYSNTNPITLILASGANLHVNGPTSFVGNSANTIEGAGTLQADGGFTKSGGSGSSSILAGTATSGGTLIVKGTIDYNIILGFANTSYASTLDIATANTNLHTISLTSSTQTLEIGANVTFQSAISAAGGTIKVDGGSTLTTGNGVTLSNSAELDVSGAVTANGIISVTASTIVLSGGTLTAGQGVTLASGAGVGGSGTLAGNINGTGMVIAVGGTLTLTKAVSNDGSHPLGLVIGSGTSLLLTSTYGIGAVGSAPTINFQGSGDIFQAVNIGLYGNSILIGTISNFSGTDLIKLGTFGAGDKIKGYDPVNHTITITNATSDASATHMFYFDPSTDVSNIHLTQQTVDGVLSDVLTICFVAGTAIRTPEGEAPVETLKRGDLVLTADGEAKPVVWLGLQTIASRFADPVRNWPIRIAAGALADNVPSCDLLVSPDHALLVEGILIHAGALVNGTSIRRERQVPEKFVYYHVELEDHSLVLAENVPAETFVDNVDRGNFDNWAEHEALYPEGRAIAELPLPRAKARRQVPASIRVALDERAIAIQESVAA